MKLPNFVVTIVLTCLLAFSHSVHAAGIGEESMACLSIGDGLAGETVNRVMTDHGGRVWIATNNGVSLFNGKQLATFRLSDKLHRTVTVADFCETADHRLYAATDAGLFEMPAGRGDFHRILPEIENPECLLAVGNTVYIGGRQGLQIYENGTLRQKDVGVSRKGLDNVVRQYLKGDSGKVLFLSRYDVKSYDPATGRITGYNIDGALSSKTALCQMCTTDSAFFIGTRNNGLYRYDLRTRKAVKIEGVGNLVTSVQMSGDGFVTVSTDGSGAYLLDAADGHIVERFDTDAEGLHRLPTNAVYSYMRDRNGVNWFGFVRYGLAYTPHNSRLFSAYGWDGFSTLGMNVRTHCMHGSDGVIGTQNGCWYVDSSRKISRYFSAAEMGGHIVNSVAWFEGEYYVGTFDGGMCVLNPKTLSLHAMAEVPLLRQASIGDIKAGPDGRLWVGSSEGLFIIDKQGNVVRYTEQNSHIVGGIIISITFDEQKNAWLTGASGLSLYSSTSNEIVEAQFPEGFFHQVHYMRGATGHDGLVYMRTGPQVYYTNAAMSSFGELPLPVTLTDKWCRSMADDAKGHLWLASERGLFRFSYNMDEMVQLGGGEGLLGEQISEVSVDDGGRLWVATSRGLFTAEPKELEAWKHRDGFRVRLYNIRRGSDLMQAGEEIGVNETSIIRLGWNMGSEVLQAEAVLNDYAPQRGRLYEYRIGDSEWKIVKDGEPIEVRGLWPGRHQMDVRQAGVEGTTSTFIIKVIPTAWAIIWALLFVVAAVLCWLWWKYRKNTRILLSERNEIEDALVAIEEELVTRDTELDNSEFASSSAQTAKYQKVKIDEKECEGIVNRMKQYIEKNKVYTNADLKMKDLADVLHLSPSKLSQVFNLYLNENYYEFINRYRLDEFKRQIEAGEYKRFTITALSEQCGFKKSNFFSTFRKVEGITPAEYLKKHGVKV